MAAVSTESLPLRHAGAQGAALQTISPVLDADIDAAVARERARNARAINAARFFGVLAFFSLFAVWDWGLGEARWQGTAKTFVPYLLASAALFVLARRSEALARRLAIGLAVLDVPAIYFVQLAQYETSSAPGVAGFTLGIFVLLVLIGLLALEPWMLWGLALSALCAEAALQWQANVSAGAIVASLVTLALAAWLAVLISQRYLKVVGEVALAEQARAQQTKLVALGRLAGGIAHDLRNPLQAVQLALDLIDLKAGQLSTDESKEYTNMARDQLRASNEIIGHLLDFARNQPLERRAVNLREAASAAMGRVTPRADVTVAAPGIGADDWVLAEDATLIRVLSNLVQNAIDAIPKGRPGKVELSAASVDASTLEVRVSDDGVGMDDALRARIFEPLFTTKRRGTGLGLAIVQDLVRRYDGELRVESTLGRGSTFIVRLKRQPTP